MHELAIAQEILAIVEHTRQREGARQVLSIELEIGQLSTVEPEALRFAMEALLPESICPEARVRYTFVEGRARCRQCSEEFALDFLYDGCPACASFDKDILAGKEMRVLSITLD